MAKMHHEFVVQEKLEGKEFAVDFVSFNGKHYLLGVNVYYKSSNFW